MVRATTNRSSSFDLDLRSSCRSARGDKTWVSGVGGR